MNISLVQKIDPQFNISAYDPQEGGSWILIFWGNDNIEVPQVAPKNAQALWGQIQVEKNTPGGEKKVYRYQQGWFTNGHTYDAILAQDEQTLELIDQNGGGGVGAVVLYHQ